VSLEAIYGVLLTEDPNISSASVSFPLQARVEADV
jgi:hypothetical protein